HPNVKFMAGYLSPPAPTLSRSGQSAPGQLQRPKDDQLRGGIEHLLGARWRGGPGGHSDLGYPVVQTGLDGTRGPPVQCGGQRSIRARLGLLLGWAIVQSVRDIVPSLLVLLAWSDSRSAARYRDGRQTGNPEDVLNPRIRQQGGGLGHSPEDNHPSALLPAGHLVRAEGTGLRDLLIGDQEAIMEPERFIEPVRTDSQRTHVKGEGVALRVTDPHLGQRRAQESPGESVGDVRQVRPDPLDALLGASPRSVTGVLRPTTGLPG